MRPAPTTIALMPSARPELPARERVGHERSRVGHEEGATDALHEPGDDEQRRRDGASAQAIEAAVNSAKPAV